MVSMLKDWMIEYNRCISLDSDFLHFPYIKKTRKHIYNTMWVHVICESKKRVTNTYVQADLKDILKSEDESNYHERCFKKSL